MNIVAILQSMWGPRRERAPLFFRINPQNRSGAKLYTVTQGHSLVVTNTASICGDSPDDYQPIDLAHLTKALDRLRKGIGIDAVLVCGNQSKEAWLALPAKYRTTPHIIMPHPAARNLTNVLLHDVRAMLNVKPLASYEFRQLKGQHVKTPITP